MARRVRRAKLCKWVLKGQPVFLTTNSTGSYDSINLSSCISRPTCLSLLGGGPGLVIVSVCPVLDEQKAGRCLWSSMGQLYQWLGLAQELYALLQVRVWIPTLELPQHRAGIAMAPARAQQCPRPLLTGWEPTEHPARPTLCLFHTAKPRQA